jgi:hypothetical protein
MHSRLLVVVWSPTAEPGQSDLTGLRPHISGFTGRKFDLLPSLNNHHQPPLQDLARSHDACATWSNTGGD